MDMDVIGSLFNASNSSSSSTELNNIKENISPDDVTALLMRSFNEAEDDNSDSSEEIDWSVSEDKEENVEDTNEESEQEDNQEDDLSEDENEDDENDDNKDNSDELEENNDVDESEEGEVLGSYEAIKDELDSERETLSDIYERFFKDVVDPLFRKLEDSNINVAFDTTKLKTCGLIRIELSHRNSEASAEMEINIFANTVNGEFLGMENSEGEAVSTSLDDVSLDDLINILIKVLD